MQVVVARAAFDVVVARTAADVVVEVAREDVVVARGAGEDVGIGPGLADRVAVGVRCGLDACLGGVGVVGEGSPVMVVVTGAGCGAAAPFRVRPSSPAW